MHAPYLTGKITHFDYEARMLFGPRVALMHDGVDYGGTMVRPRYIMAIRQPLGMVVPIKLAT